MEIQPAEEKDVDSIYELISFFSKKGLLLQRPRQEILHNLKSFWVVRMRKKLIACAAYDRYRNNLFEIRSVAVAPGFQGRGIGEALVRHIEDYLVKHKGAEKFFVLTYAVDFFRKLGYTIVDKRQLPEKIWQVCVGCPKFDSCDEIAMIKEVNSL